MTGVALNHRTSSSDETLAPEALLAAAMVPPRRTRWKRAFAKISRYWLLAAFIIVWELVSTFGQSVNPQLDVMLPPPTALFSAAQDLWARGALIMHIVDGLRRGFVAVGGPQALGGPFGLAWGCLEVFHGVVAPFFEFTPPTPPLAWIPLSILWFGIGDAQIEYIIFLAAF